FQIHFTALVTPHASATPRLKPYNYSRPSIETSSDPSTKRTSANKSTSWASTSSASRRTGVWHKHVVRSGLNTLCPF
ncbi:hypothetical protein E4U32_003476, partial [Claviceps aff. humidiphila group G2b]